MCLIYPKYEGVHIDKGYQGAEEVVRDLNPKNEQSRSQMTMEEAQEDSRMFYDRIIVKMYLENCVVHGLLPGARIDGKNLLLKG